MITIDLPKDKAQALHAEIEAAGGRVEIVDEKRLFGDAATVTVVFEGAKSLIELVSVSLSAWCAYTQIKGTANGKPVSLQDDSPHDVAKKLDQA